MKRGTAIAAATMAHPVGASAPHYDHQRRSQPPRNREAATQGWGTATRVVSVMVSAG